MKKFIIFSILFMVALIGIFVIVPNALELFGFSGQSFFAGEFWRILSFPFAHVSSLHLLENLIAMFILILLAKEFNLGWQAFALIFFSSGVIIALFSGIIYPYLLIAGSSLGIFSVFGALAFKDKELLPCCIIPAFFGIIIFLNFIYNIYVGEGVAQPIYHAAGFVVGAALFQIKSVRRRKRILQ